MLVFWGLSLNITNITFRGMNSFSHPHGPLKLVPEVHALCYGRYMLCRSLKALGFPHGKPLPRSAGCIGSTPPKGRYDFAHMPRLLSIWVKMLQHCFGSCKIHKRWGFLWWQALIIKMWGPFMPSLGKHGDMRFRRLPNLILRLLPKIGTPKNDIKLFFHVHSYSTIRS